MELAAGVATVLSSGVVAGLTTFFLNTGQAERMLRRAKLEELCGLLHFSLKYVKIARDQLIKCYEDPNHDGVSALHDAIAADKAQHDKLSALIAIYFPTLKPQASKCAAAMAIMIGLNNKEGTKDAVIAHADAVVTEVRKLQMAALALAPSVHSLWPLRRRTPK